MNINIQFFCPNPVFFSTWGQLCELMNYFQPPKTKINKYFLPIWCQCEPFTNYNFPLSFFFHLSRCFQKRSPKLKASLLNYWILLRTKKWKEESKNGGEKKRPPSWTEINSHNKMFVFLFLLTRLPISCSHSWQVLQLTNIYNFFL